MKPARVNYPTNWGISRCACWGDHLRDWVPTGWGGNCSNLIAHAFNEDYGEEDRICARIRADSFVGKDFVGTVGLVGAAAGQKRFSTGEANEKRASKASKPCSISLALLMDSIFKR